MFPELAVRELVLTAPIHQDCLVTIAGPMVEIFEDRVEIANSGESLVGPQRFVDLPPRSRNESLPSFMRRIGICEERRSGWVKAVFRSEVYRLPTPLVEVVVRHNPVVLFSSWPLSGMDRAKRVRTLNLHAYLRYLDRGFLTDTSLRKRFGIEVRNRAKASRLIA